ncbi:MAG: hypothetical protein ACUVX1_09770 [Chloroflexota bacterium]
MLKWLRSIPGFRSGTWWKAIIALVGYAIIGFYIVDGARTHPGMLLLGLDALVIAILATNGWGLRSRLPLFNSPNLLKASVGWIGLALVGGLALWSVTIPPTADTERLSIHTVFLQPRATPTASPSWGTDAARTGNPLLGGAASQTATPAPAGSPYPTVTPPPAWGPRAPSSLAPTGSADSAADPSEQGRTQSETGVQDTPMEVGPEANPDNLPSEWSAKAEQPEPSDGSEDDWSEDWSLDDEETYWDEEAYWEDETYWDDETYWEGKSSWDDETYWEDEF